MSIATHPDHAITVTGGGPFGRAWFDCSCGESAVRATKRAANIAALVHHHETAGCNCPPDVVASDVHPIPGPGHPAPVVVHTSG
ncbi:hypothetical protein ABKW28_12955 [Nocardioides sp. 31GB23]|uniref:hypothetical protein n=1 Tax=Nocardioides sp. 31GB23 TaxID=3156065 RepID=UPI0032AF7725